jgi:hypothetical protein
MEVQSPDEPTLQKATGKSTLDETTARGTEAVVLLELVRACFPQACISRVVSKSSTLVEVELVV